NEIDPSLDRFYPQTDSRLQSRRLNLLQQTPAHGIGLARTAARSRWLADADACKSPLQLPDNGIEARTMKNFDHQGTPGFQHAPCQLERDFDQFLGTRFVHRLHAR